MPVWKRPARSPTHTTATSAACAQATASGMRSVRAETGEGWSSEVLVSTSPGKTGEPYLRCSITKQPRAKAILSLPNACSKAARGVTTWDADSPASFRMRCTGKLYPHSGASGSSAVGPMRAIRWPRAGSRGRTPRFSSTTTDWRATSRARATVAGDCRSIAASSAYGRSKRPSRSFSTRTRFTAASIVSVDSRPRETASPSAATQSSAGSSTSRPALKASAAASARSRARLWCW